MKFNKSEGENFLLADKIHLTNLLHNLIDNAIKYTTTDPEILLVLKQQNDHIELRIADNGIGIEKKYHDKVFDRFFRVAEDDIHNVKGYGIGLHYVKDIVNKHGGKIFIESAIGHGTQIIINLPK